MSQIEVKVNRVLMLILVFQLILCLIMGILYGLLRNSIETTHTYISWSTNTTPIDSLLIALTYFVLINTMIPISLVVSIEIVKMAQSIFIKSDKLMYS